jgi:hypothetical protein
VELPDLPRGVLEELGLAEVATKETRRGVEGAADHQGGLGR